MKRRNTHVALIDHGSGNLRSLKMALEAVGAEVEIVATADTQSEFTHFVLPGVGAFGRGMQGLNKFGLVDLIRQFASNSTPGLGICLGMQLLFDQSDEDGGHAGLGLIPGNVVRIDSIREGDLSNMVTLPNIGWRPVKWKKGGRYNMQFGHEYYFVHSYGVASNNPHATAEIDYMGALLAAEVQYGKLLGCQFHPEKSGQAGLDYLEQFLNGEGQERQTEALQKTD